MKCSNIVVMVVVALVLGTCGGRGTPDEGTLSAQAVQGILDALVGTAFAHEFEDVAEVSLTLEGFGTTSLPVQVGGKPTRPFRAEDFHLVAVMKGGTAPRGLKVLLCANGDGSVVVDAWAQRPPGGRYKRVALHQSGDVWFVDKVLAQALYL